MITGKPKTIHSTASRKPVDPARPEPDARQAYQERYRVFIEDVADGFYETDLKGNFKFFNNALCRIFGYPRERIQDRNFREFMDADHAQQAYEQTHRVFKTGQAMSGMIWEIVNQDGEVRVLEMSAKPISTSDGKTIGFRGIARDVTDKHLAQKALEESEQCALELYRSSRRAEQRYRSLPDFFPDPVMVFGMDGTVTYLNPAALKVFGWTLEELVGRKIPFIPESLKAEARRGLSRLLSENSIYGFKTKRLTRDGRLLDIVLNAAVHYDAENKPAGQIVVLRDITREARIERINQTLFRVSEALHQVFSLNERLEITTQEIQNLLQCEGASVILLDEEKGEFYFPVAAYDDPETGRKMREIRFPADKGVAGYVYRTGQPLIVEDTRRSPYFYRQVDEKSEYETRNMLDVPIRIQNRLIGVLCAVNKKEGVFDQADLEWLTTVANLVGLPIENARIHEALQRSYEEVKAFNRAKDRVIHHLSHELKTPVSVLAASLSLLRKRLANVRGTDWQTILDRATRNLNRILDMQYEIQDILRDRDYSSYQMLSTLLDACSDELETLISMEIGEKDLLRRVRSQVESLFGPREAVAEPIDLEAFAAERIAELGPRHAHRTCELIARLSPVAKITIPRDVLRKVIDGLIRNAVENTPDQGRIEVSVMTGAAGPEFQVKDTGVGMTPEIQRLLFDNYFAPAEKTLQYASRRPFDFNAGGRGFDLIRMKIFSERYHFDLRIDSERCGCLSVEPDEECPGDVDGCMPDRNREECLNSGGTTVTVAFKPGEPSN